MKRVRLVLACVVSAAWILAVSPVARSEDSKPEEAKPEEKPEGAKPEEKPAAPDVRPHTDEQVAPALAKFATEFAAKDVEDRLKAVRTIGRWRHKKVLKELTRILERDPDLELKAAAALAIGNQVPFAKEAVRTLAKNLVAWEKWAARVDPQGDDAVQNEDEARVLSNAIAAISTLGSKDVWEQIEGFIDHPHDGPAAAMMQLAGKNKEWRAIPRILEWFNFYPDGLSWSGGSVSVDTGSAGNEDAVAAKAKWQAKYGSRRKKARPEVFKLMVMALKDITGIEFKKNEELKQWMKDNKALLKKHGV